MNCLVKFKEYLKTAKHTKRLYYSFVGLISSYRTKQKQRYMHNYGYRTIYQLQDIFEKSGVMFFFDMGTLLGIVRDGRILSHDLDIDIAVYVSNEEEKISFVEHLIMNGCKHRYSYSIDSIGIVEDSFILNKIKFDICYYYQGSGYDVCYLMFCLPNVDYAPGYQSVVKLSCTPIHDTVKIRFHEGNITIPSRAEKYLSERYGSEWTIPNKDYIYWKGPSAKLTELFALRTVFKK